MSYVICDHSSDWFKEKEGELLSYDISVHSSVWLKANVANAKQMIPSCVKKIKNSYHHYSISDPKMRRSGNSG